MSGDSPATSPLPRRSWIRGSHATTTNHQPAAIPGLAVRGYRFRGLQQVDLFWSGSSADGFGVYRDGRCIAVVSGRGYTDRVGRNGSGSYRYRVRELATEARSNEAAVTFR